MLIIPIFMKFLWTAPLRQLAIFAVLLITKSAAIQRLANFPVTPGTILSAGLVLIAIIPASATLAPLPITKSKLHGQRLVSAAI